MRRLDARLIGGLLLVGAGIIYLLQNLGYLHWANLIWATAAAVAGLMFLALVVGNRNHWWAVIPGLALLAIAAIIALGYLAPSLVARWGGPILIGAIGLSFWVIYLLDRGLWWGLIPGGVLLTLAGVATLDRDNGPQLSGVFFLGLSATFLLVGIAPNPHGALRWAFIPAAVLFLLGLLLSVGFQAAVNYIWPMALIAVGLFVILRAFRPRA